MSRSNAMTQNLKNKRMENRTFHADLVRVFFIHA